MLASGVDGWVMESYFNSKVSQQRIDALLASFSKLDVREGSFSIMARTDPASTVSSSSRLVSCRVVDGRERSSLVLAIKSFKDFCMVSP